MPYQRDEDYRPSKADQLAIRAGRAEIGRGEYRELQEILNDLDRPSRKTGRKATRKGTR
jgi:predicted transcriptional regulator